MMSNKQWKFCGRYGDKDEIVQITTTPNKLSDKLKNALTLLYQGSAKEFYDCGVSMDDGYKLQEFGLARQIGNAWNHSLMWAPQVHAWMKGNDKNDVTTAELRSQYV